MEVKKKGPAQEKEEALPKLTPPSPTPTARSADLPSSGGAGCIAQNLSIFSSTDPLASNLRGGRIMTGSTSHRWILFSFDDGPHLLYTPILLEELAAAEVRALFFFIASQFDEKTPYERRLAQIAKKTAEQGHFIGSHSFAHIPLSQLRPKEFPQAIDRANDVFKALFGAAPALFRPPGGRRTPQSDAYLAERGLTQVLWNIRSGDIEARTSSEILATFRRNLLAIEKKGERGGIVLLHDNHKRSVEAFSRILAYLELRNCKFLKEGEELYDFIDDPALFFEKGSSDGSPSDFASPQIPRWLWALRQARARERAQK
ncbi:MAG: polysaccharide deacetylase family protein, partial [Deltaproteobacteria bacterium]|nr:polysaccharide deacetylase family protein [Deltaproteobacteria bacterium]